MFTHYNQFARTTQNVFGMPVRVVFDALDMNHQHAYLESQKPQAVPTLTQREIDAQDPATAKIREATRRMIADAKNRVPVDWDELPEAPEKTVKNVEIDRTKLPQGVNVTSDGIIVFDMSIPSLSRIQYQGPTNENLAISIKNGSLVIDPSKLPSNLDDLSPLYGDEDEGFWDMVKDTLRNLLGRD